MVSCAQGLCELPGGCGGLLMRLAIPYPGRLLPRRRQHFASGCFSSYPFWGFLPLTVVKDLGRKEWESARFMPPRDIFFHSQPCSNLLLNTTQLLFPS